jgi:hypothetical protein
MYPSGYPVKLNPAVLEDQSLKSNHHLFRRILQEERMGEIREKDAAKSTPDTTRYWVKFQFVAILLSEQHLLPAGPELA